MVHWSIQKDIWCQALYLALGCRDEYDSPCSQGHYGVGHTRSSSSCVTGEPPASDVCHTCVILDLALFLWQARDSHNTLKDICDKPKGTQRCKGFPFFPEK